MTHDRPRGGRQPEARLDLRNRYAILHRVQTATKAETRARRIAEFIRMLARHERVHP